MPVINFGIFKYLNVLLDVWKFGYICHWYLVLCSVCTKFIPVCFYTGYQFLPVCFYTGFQFLTVCFYTGYQFLPVCFYTGFQFLPVCFYTKFQFLPVCFYTGFQFLPVCFTQDSSFFQFVLNRIPVYSGLVYTGYTV
jgi:hypothetical protein